ncbi:hypothetical protein IC582_028660 [Cucumis melo]
MMVPKFKLHIRVYQEHFKKESTHNQVSYALSQSPLALPYKSLLNSSSW